MRFTLRKTAVAALVGIGLLGGAALAQDAGKAVGYRQSVFTALSWHTGAIGAMAKGSAPFDTAALAHHAEAMNALSHMVLEGFPDGSQDGAGTKAKPEIWSDRAGFEKDLQALQTATAALAAAAPTMTAAQLPDALNAVGQACKTCHQSYRN